MCPRYGQTEISKWMVTALKLHNEAEEVGGLVGRRSDKQKEKEQARLYGSKQSAFQAHILAGVRRVGVMKLMLIKHEMCH